MCVPVSQLIPGDNKIDRDCLLLHCYTMCLDLTTKSETNKQQTNYQHLLECMLETKMGRLIVHWRFHCLNSISQQSHWFLMTTLCTTSHMQIHNYIILQYMLLLHWHALMPLLISGFLHNWRCFLMWDFCTSESCQRI